MSVDGKKGRNLGTNNGQIMISLRNIAYSILNINTSLLFFRGWVGDNWNYCVDKFFFKLSKWFSLEINDFLRPISSCYLFFQTYGLKVRTFRVSAALKKCIKRVEFRN